MSTYTRWQHWPQSLSIEEDTTNLILHTATVVLLTFDENLILSALHALSLSRGHFLIFFHQFIQINQLQDDKKFPGCFNFAFFRVDFYSKRVFWVNYFKFRNFLIIASLIKSE